MQKGRKELRKFGLTVGSVLAVLAAVLVWRARPSAPYVAAVAATLFVGGLLAPGLLRPVEKVWMKIAEALGFVSTRVILAVAFYLIILPFGLVIRILGRDLLSLKIEPDAETYWSKAEVDGPRTRPTKPY
jgi:ABC-type uncharacterized transport system permease subunit